jgi:hypothetical protein
MSQQILRESPERTRQHVERRKFSPDSARSFQGELHPVARLQRMLGNRRLAQLIQARQLTREGEIIGLQRKLTVGAASDRYEQEAERVAREVMNVPDAMAAASAQRAPSSAPVQNQTLQTRATEEKKAEPIPARSAGARHDTFEAGANVEAQVNLSKGRGSPLPHAVRAYMEPRFGVDFSHVRVHTGSDALQMNQAVGAQAFTHGSDIYFGADHSPTNLKLTAHELTHVVQQTGGVPLQTKKRAEAGAPPGPDPSIQRIPVVPTADDREENGAEPVSRQTESTTPRPSVSEETAEPGGDGAGRQGEEMVVDAKLMLELAATGLGLHELTIEGSVGRGGKNRPRDVAAVAARLLALGYPPGSTLSDLADAIKRYQAEVVGMTRQDGRVDPGGKTILALAAMKRAPAAAEPPAATPAPATPPPAAEPPAAPPPAATPTPAAAGPRGTPQDPELAQLVAAARNPQVDAAADNLADLEKKFMGLKRSSSSNEEVGKERDELVEGFRSLRTQIAAFDKAGLDPKVAAALKTGFYRAINAISPFYYQKLNIILEFDRVNKTTGKVVHIYNTCNITSLAMTLEALGKSAADYKYKALIPPIAQVFEKDVKAREEGGRAHEKVGTELSGLRLPDYIAMAAIVWQMGYKKGSPEEILKGANDAFNNVASAKAVKKLAEDFGASATIGEFKLDPGAKKDAGQRALKQFGAKHSTQALVKAEVAMRLREIERRLERETKPAKRAKLEKEKAELQAKLAKMGPLSDAAIESVLPLEQYKQAVLKQIGPELDSGRQIVAGQYHHFVRLQAVTDEFVIKDDPGGFTRGNMQLTWEEARAMGLFWHWILIG